MTVTTQMKAIQVSKTGDTSVLEYLDLPCPTKESLAADEVLIKNHYSGVNYIDIYFRTGVYPTNLPLILGREGSGEVAAVGSEVRDFKVGDRVAYLSTASYAAYVPVSQKYVIQLPDYIQDDMGAACLLQGMTAVMLTQHATNVKKGDYVFVHAAVGGTGYLVCQVAHQLGAIVIGSVSTPEKAAVARENGVDHVIQYTTENVLERVMEITHGKGCQVVFDGVGKSTFDTSLACLGHLGTLASFGNASGKVDPVDVLKLVRNGVKLCRPTLFEFIKTREEFINLITPVFTLLKEKKLRVKIQKVYDLSEAAQAHTDLESKSTMGKLLLKIEH